MHGQRLTLWTLLNRVSAERETGNIRRSKCGFENPAGMKFRGQCTAALALVCGGFDTADLKDAKALLDELSRQRDAVCS